MIKDVKDIRDEYFDEGKLSAKSIKDLICHIENDPSPERSISLVADARLLELVPLIAKHLDHEDDYVRELTVGCLIGRLKLPDYAEKALNMAQEDPDGGPRSLAISNLGAVINKVNPVLKKRIAVFLYGVLINSEYDDLDKQFAFNSILKAIDIPMPQRRTTPCDENHDFVKQFKIKYDV